MVTVILVPLLLPSVSRLALAVYVSEPPLLTPVTVKVTLPVLLAIPPLLTPHWPLILVLQEPVCPPPETFVSARKISSDANVSLAACFRLQGERNRSLTGNKEYRWRCGKTSKVKAESCGWKKPLGFISA